MTYKMTVKVAMVTLMATAFTSGSFAVEQPKIHATAATTIRAAGNLSGPLDQSARPKMLTVNAIASEGRSANVSSSLEESNTVGMLLAGLAIMGLVVRRRMN